MINSSEKIPIIQKKFAATGGYDFYWTLGKAIKAYVEQKTDDEIDDILLSVRNPSERKYNKEAFKCFVKRYGTKQLQYFNDDVVYSASPIIDVIVSPSFVYFDEDGAHAVAVWSAQYPKLTKPYAALACLIQRMAFEGTRYSNLTFHFCDLVGNRAYSETVISKSTRTMLSIEARNISEIISAVDRG
jgi:hypothetical protein